MTQLVIKKKINSGRIPNAYEFTAEEITSIVTKVNEHDTSIGVLQSTVTGTNSANLTANTPVGRVVSGSLNTASGAETTITILNSTVTAADIVSVTMNSYAGAGTPIIRTVTPGVGDVDVVIRNIHASIALNATMTLDFAVHGNVA